MGARDGFGESARAHAGIGEVRGGKPRHAICVAAQAIFADATVADVAIDEAELPVDVFTLASLPSVAVAHDFIVVAADEIPPHADFFPQWFAADKSCAAHLIRIIADAQTRFTDAGVSNLRLFQLGVCDHDGSGVSDHAVFKFGVEVKHDFRTWIDGDFRADYRCVRIHRAGCSHELTHKHLELTTIELSRWRFEIGQVALGSTAHGIRQRNPQLHAMQDRGLLRGGFCMRNAITGSHQIELAGMYKAASAAGIDVADLAGK